MTPDPQIRPFFDEATKTVTYLVWDAATLDAAIIDPVLDYDHASGEVDTRSVEQVLAVAGALGLKVVWALETHAHADHLSGAPYVKAKTGATVGIGAILTRMQRWPSPHAIAAIRPPWKRLSVGCSTRRIPGGSAKAPAGRWPSR